MKQYDAILANDKGEVIGTIQKVYKASEVLGVIRDKRKEYWATITRTRKKGRARTSDLLAVKALDEVLKEINGGRK